MQRADYAPIVFTNAAPNPEEVVAVQQGINRLKSEIARAKSPRLQELEEDLRLHEAVFSPLRQVPFEVLGEIFTLVLSNDGVLPYRTSGHRLVELCLVCRIWRDAALSARWLWSRVLVETVSEKVICWLNRSGNLPKGLAVETESECSLSGRPCAGLASECKSRNAKLAKFLSDGPILDHLELWYSGPQCFRNLIEALHVLKAISKPKTRPWDRLRSLTLEFDNEWDEPEDVDLSPFLHIPSSVTSLNFALPDMSFRETLRPQVDIPSEILRRLKSFAFTSDWDGYQCLRLLKHCQNVETLTLKQHRPFHEPAFLAPSQLPDSIVHLPNLRILRLQDLGPRVAANIFCFLRSPKLFFLDIKLAIGGRHTLIETDRFSESVLSFVKQSECESTLRQLCIHWSLPYVDEALEHLLRGLPSVTHLTLYDIQNATFLEKIRSPTIILPRLEVLELFELNRSISFDDILAFLQARRSVKWYDGTPVFYREDTLKKMTMTYEREWLGTWQRDPRYEDNPYLNTLRRWGGMVINVGHGRYHEA